MALNVKNRQNLLTILAAIVVGLFAADKLIVGPLTTSWKQRATRVTELRKQVADGRQLLNHEQSWRTRWEQMRTNTFPVNPSVAEQQLHQAFDRWSQESRISVTSISPQWKHDADDYMTLECRVEASGNLGTITRFLYEIEKDPMALRLENLEISSRDNDGQTLSVGLQVSGLVLLSKDSKQ